MLFTPPRVARTIHLVWRRLGVARFYVAAIAVALLVLAAIGLVKIVVPPRDQLRVTGRDLPDTPVASSPAAPLATSEPVPNQEVARDPLLVITDIKSHRRRLRDRRRLVAARIGVAPQGSAKVSDVDIRVFFYDVTRDGEIRPTAADVAHEWLTPVRDWANPAPKYLVATYLRRRESRSATEQLRYGGFLVQVFANGQLQDERSEPEHVLAKLRDPTSTTDTVRRGDRTLPVDPVDANLEEIEDDPAAESDVSATESSATVPSTPSQRQTSPVAPVTASSSAPYGQPVPGKPGFVFSLDNQKFIIDVRGMPSGTEINDPYAKKPLRVP